jgi:phage terminase large subunit-like protein
MKPESDYWRNFRRTWKKMTPRQQENWINDHSDEEINAINWWLVHYAREEQLPPPGDWFVWFLRSGRGYGKTRTGAETVLQWVEEGYTRIAIVGQTKADVRDTMIEVGDSSITQVAPLHDITVRYEPSKRRIVFPEYDAIAIIYSGDEPNQLRGPQHEKAWVDELAKFKYPEKTWSNLLFGLRIGDKPQIVVTTTPRPIKIIKELLAKPTTVDVRRPTYDNIDNLSDIYIREVVKPVEGTRIGRQEIGGEILDDDPRALWKRDDIEDHRKLGHPDLYRVGVAMDPAGTSTGDECGIVGGGIAKLGDETHLYVLEDVTVQGSPKAQASAAIALYNKLRADCIIAEVNNGGEWIPTVINGIDKSVNVKVVHASRGKKTRAEPVSALYEQGRGHHVGTFADLEDELCQWVPGESDSPNRLDALVWLATELVLGSGEGWAGWWTGDPDDPQMKVAKRKGLHSIKGSRG